MMMHRATKAIAIGCRGMRRQLTSGSAASSKRRNWVWIAAAGVGVIGAGYLGLRLTGNDVALARAFYAGGHNAVLMLPPEMAHKIGLIAADFGLFPKSNLGSKPQLETRVWDLQFTNPIGLAAGLSKDGQGIRALLDAGFAFVEVGSVCKEPQPGNPKPRVFRLPEDAAVINRYGFNTAGADAVATRLQRYRAKHAGTAGIVGVNVGQNKWVEEADAAKAYREVITQLGQHADYLVVNVSSPNTPGLRALQRREMIRDLLLACQQARDALRATPTARKVPLLVKVSPDLGESEESDIAQVVLELGIDGIIVANTTVTRPEYLTNSNKTELGGLSGRPLKGISTQAILRFHTLTQGRVPIIGVGGVENGRDVFDKILAGASLVQVYTAIIYQGPQIIDTMNEELATLLAKYKFESVQDAVGKWSSVYRED